MSSNREVIFFNVQAILIVKSCCNDPTSSNSNPQVEDLNMKLNKHHRRRKPSYSSSAYNPHPAYFATGPNPLQRTLHLPPKWWVEDVQCVR